MATMNISLPDAMKTWVEEQVATGRYANASDYVRDMLRRDQELASRRARFDQLVQEGLDSGVVETTREELLERMRRIAAEAAGLKHSA
ncbi:type II toxin-antitoxin system ParD family antitoxin [Devosia rhizoryzae]|uniref:Type II toxin-antitoxin system ParD family antitoxin n=1 Tax=Devosia rhizoryzae TaxID=2774137 RepID=A0ABX7C667_9HYPH|nr:type II toxin-antitoxin system ParD family antitoxin [Devosia rhizoryzae]QQR39706.1 type II toxin-antitoxin system ParD family antitoxin [Devosia rhizoryzae]